MHVTGAILPVQPPLDPPPPSHVQELEKLPHLLYSLREQLGAARTPARRAMRRSLIAIATVQNRLYQAIKLEAGPLLPILLAYNSPQSAAHPSVANLILPPPQRRHHHLPFRPGHDIDDLVQSKVEGEYPETEDQVGHGYLGKSLFHELTFGHICSIDLF